MEAGGREGDLLGRFRFPADEAAEAGGGDSDEIDLELSLGGCFSSQDRESNRLVRSSSIPALLPHEFPPAVPLARTCSLPNEVEEELRRRREVQSLKRMEAMRKMEEKRSLKRAGETLVEELEGASAAKIRRVQLEKSDGTPSTGLPRWVEGAAGLIVSALPQASQGSIASQGSNSSGGTELESRPRQAGIVFSSGFELRSPSKVLTFTEHNAPEATNGTALQDSILPDEILLRMNGGGNGGELRRNMMDEMPSVSTKCDGPNGRRIEGFLYKYRRGEEVRIVCVCHGSFLTPAEFVKHGGGGDVAHPLRHIVVNPSPAALL